MLAPAGAAEDANVPIHGHTEPVPGCFKGQPFLVNGTGRYYVEKLDDSMIYILLLKHVETMGFYSKILQGVPAKLSLKPGTRWLQNVAAIKTEKVRS